MGFLPSSLSFHFYFLGCAPWYASLTALSMAYAVYIWVDARSE